MLERDYRGQDCSIAATLELIGERWTILVIRDIWLGRRRFGLIQENLGIARNVLSARLRRLLDAGIIEKRIYRERPERYEYFLTEKGLDLWPVMVAMIGWGDRHLAGPDGPAVAIVHKECGGAVDDRRICERCGEALGVRDARAVSLRDRVPAAR
jgi:DNA-binding HxlR family transcriptional regulator